MSRMAILAVAAIGATGAVAEAANVAGWRTDWTGRYPDAKPPVTWGRESNVVWKAKLPDWSNATPVPVGDRLLLCAEPATLLCVSATDGRILWQQTNTFESTLAPADAARAREEQAKAAEIRAKLNPLNGKVRKLQDQLKKTPEDAAAQGELAGLTNEVAQLKKALDGVSTYALPATHGVNGYSTPTPVTDGKRVWVVFGSGVVACHDLDGKRLWSRFVEKPKNSWGHSASPVLVANRLVVQVMKVWALNPDTGETVWQTPSAPAWGSPVATRVGETDVVITPSGDVIAAADGKVLAPKVSGLTYCAPIVVSNVAYFIQNGGKAVRLTPGAGGAVSAETLWETKSRDERYYASPVYADGLIYACNQKSIFSAIDAATGAIVYEQDLKLGATVYPSVTFAGNLVYVSGEAGRTAVIEAGREFKELARNQVEAFRACPVFVGGRLYLRTMGYLYCMGGEGK